MLTGTLSNAGRDAVMRAAWSVARRRPARVDPPLSTWGLGVAPNGHLARRGLDLVEMVEHFGSPLHVVDGQALDRNADAALVAVDDESPVDVYYSYKTNPVPGVLARLHGRGIGAEVISAYELWLALRLGVEGDRIIYNGPAKSDDSLVDAVRAGVLVNANSDHDVRRITRAAAEVGLPARLGLRVSLPSMWGGQFGFDPSAGGVERVVEAASTDPLIDLVGLHFHRGMVIRTAADLGSYVGDVLAYVGWLDDETGWTPDVLDVGGSLSTPTVDVIPRVQYRLNRAFGSDLLPPDPTEAVGLADAATMVRDAVSQHFVARDRPIPRIVLEPGRAITGNTQLLLTTVVDVKRDGPLPHAVLDAGINIAETVQDEYHQLFSATAPTGPIDRSYRLAGPICTPADVLYNHWRLPRLEPGHVLAIMDAGAYFVPFSTSFSFPRPAIVLQDGEDVTPLRAAEDFEDLVRNDVATPAPS